MLKHMGSRHSKVESGSIKTEPPYKIEFRGHVCTITIGLDPEFITCFKMEVLMFEEDLRSAKRVLKELESGEPLDRYFFGRVAIWTRPKDNWDPKNSDKIIEIRQNASSDNFHLELAYNPTNIEFIKKMVRSIVATANP